MAVQTVQTLSVIPTWLASPVSKNMATLSTNWQPYFPQVTSDRVEWPKMAEYPNGWFTSLPSQTVPWYLVFPDLRNLRNPLEPHPRPQTTPGLDSSPATSGVKRPRNAFTILLPGQQIHLSERADMRVDETKRSGPPGRWFVPVFIGVHPSEVAQNRFCPAVLP